MFPRGPGSLPVEAAPGVGSAATWPLHLLLGWLLAGSANGILALWSSSASASSGAWSSHAVDLGRHLAFGLVASSGVWAARRFRPRPALLGWLVFLALSVALGAAVLPADLDGLAERVAEDAALPVTVVMAGIVAAVGGALPAVAALTRERERAWERALHRRAFGVLRVVSATGIAIAAFYLNVTTSPGTNPSAHLFLSFVTAIAAGHALPRLELVPRASRPTLAVGGAVLAAWGAWALFGPHSNTVMIQLARRPSALQLAALIHTDGGLDTVQAALASRAGPFFLPRAGLPAAAPTPGRPAGTPIVIFLSIDSLRADVPRHPEHRKHMPNLVQLMAEGADFTHARAPGSMTKYTISSVSTGKYFSQQQWTRRGKSYWPRQDDGPHVAALLSEAGVFTAAFPSSRWFLDRLGLVQGFEHSAFEGEPMPGKQSTWMQGSSLTRQLIERLERESARTGYYWLHYLDSHHPFHAAGKRGSKFQRYLRSLGVVDGFIGEVRAAIERLGLAERVLLIVTSDHGEAFGEHDSSFHGDTLYDELVRVPLVVRGPGVVPREIATAVSLIDLGPTVLDWFGVATPPSFMGESLVPFLLGGSRELSRPIAAETGLKQSLLFADGHKVIRDLRRQTLELYDLEADPGELHNLSDDIDPDQDEHVLLLESFFQTHTYRKDGYRVPYVK